MDTNSTPSDSRTSKARLSESEFESSLSNSGTDNEHGTSPIIVSDTEETLQDTRDEDKIDYQKKIQDLEQQASFWKCRYIDFKNFYNEMHTLGQQRFDQHARLSVNLETNFRCQLDNISMQYNRLHQEFIKQIEEVHGSVQLEVQCAKSTLAKYSGTRSPRKQASK